MCGGNTFLDFLHNGFGDWAEKKHIALVTTDIPSGVGVYSHNEFVSYSVLPSVHW